jgi:Putative  PD-(D/E)XK family member, (DUF4420)
MVQQNNLEELLTAWRALQGLDTGEGWRTIPVSSKLSLRLRAGRRFPENEEAVLFAFSSTCIPKELPLPQGGGFRVSRVELEGESADLVWMALSRLQAGNLDLFLTIVRDIFTVLKSPLGTDEKLLFRMLLARIIAWQDFMERGRLPVLSIEAEIGLVGELGVLSDLIKSGVPAQDAVESWQGPLNGIWDFETRRGAIEAKSTLSTNGFPVKIGALDQLDDSRISPLLLVGVRLAINDSGVTLPELAGNLRENMVGSPTTFATFTRRLLLAGFSDLYADQYVNRFLRINERFFLVDENFPRLTRADIPSEITDVSYTLDLDKIRIAPLQPDQIIKQFEVLWKWN